MPSAQWKGAATLLHKRSSGFRSQTRSFQQVRRRNRCTASRLGVLLALCFATSPLWAQSESSLFQLPERELLQQLSRAEEAIAQARYSDAVLELGTLLSHPQMNAAGEQEGTQQDYFVAAAGVAQVRKSLKGEAQRLLGALPRAGRELYELQFGADARKLLDDAVQQGDESKLNELVRRFFHTQAGYEGMVLLGRIQLDRGQPLAAALCFQRVLDSPAAKSLYEPELSILLAACWADAGLPDQARETLQQTRNRFPAATLTVQGKRVSVNEGEPLEWLAKYLGSTPTSQAAEAAEWLVHRGNSARNAATAGGNPLTSFRWRTPSVTDPVDERLVRELSESYHSQGIATIPSVQPLAVGGVILMRTPERLLAVDFDSGKRIWEYPWFNIAVPTTLPLNRNGTPNAENQERQRLLQQRLWLDAVFGQVSSDQQSVYLLEDTNFHVPTNEVQRFFPGQPGFPRLEQASPAQNQLVALDLEREGSLKWGVGGETGGDEPKLAGCFFLGPPLPLLGQLYTIAEVNQELRLVVLDPQSGRQLWSQQLVHAADGFGSSLSRDRRIAGATPSFANGVLVCPTSSGGVVAVDLASRSLLWGYAYPTSTEPIQQRFGAFPSFRVSEPRKPGDGWTDASVMIVDGHVLLTPLESNHLICLDLLTGQPKWPPQQRESDLDSGLYVACAHDGQFVVVSKASVRALRVADGKLAWEEPILLDKTAGELPSGRGFRSGDFYYLPTTARRLLKIDLTTGRIADEVETPFALGNLICYRDQIVSQGVDQVAAFYQIDRLRRDVNERLAQDAQDAWALARQGELLIHDGQYRQALASLRQAHQLTPQDLAVRAALVTTFLTVLREDFAAHDEFGADVAPLIDRPESRLEYLRLMALGWESQQQLLNAARNYLELADLSLEQQLSDGTSDTPLLTIEPKLSVRLDRWVASRLQDLYQRGDATLRKELDDAITARLQKADPEDSLQGLRLMTLFGFHVAANPLIGRTVQDLVQNEQLLQADLIWEKLADRAAPELAGSVLAKLAVLLVQQGRTDLAIRAYQRLETKFANQVCLDGQTGSQLAAAARTALGTNAIPGNARPRSMWDPVVWPYGKVEVQTGSGERAVRRSFNRDLIIPITSQVKAHDPNLSITYRLGLGALVLTGGDGQERLQFRVDQGQSRDDGSSGINSARIWGQLLVITMGTRIIAVDLTQSSDKSAILWQKDLNPTVSDAGSFRVSKFESRQFTHPLYGTQVDFRQLKDSNNHNLGFTGPITESGVILIVGRSLLCLHPISGEVVWRRELEPYDQQVFGDDEFLFVCGLDDEQATVIRTRDGAVLGSKRVPVASNRWVTAGRMILEWATAVNDVQVEQQVQQQTQTVVKFYDPWQEKVVWTETFAEGSRATLLTDATMAVLEPGGRFLVRNLRDEPPLVSATLAPNKQLMAIETLVSQDQMLLAVSTGAKSGGGGVNVNTISPNLPSLRLHGSLYAFDLRTGQTRWESPALVEDYILPLTQPVDVPTLWLIRHSSTPQSRSGNQPSDMISVVCLDRRDGRILFQKEAVPGDLGSYEFDVDLDALTVSFSIAGQTWKLRFTDQPVPPEPPAQLIDTAVNKPRGGILRQAADAVLRAILSGPPQ